MHQGFSGEAKRAVEVCLKEIPFFRDLVRSISLISRLEAVLEEAGFAKKKKEVPEKARLAQKSKDAVFFFLFPFRFYVKKKSKIRKGRNLAIGVWGVKSRHLPVSVYARIRLDGNRSPS